MKLDLAPGVALPLDIITMRSLVLGVSGSGKSTFGRLLAEKVHEAGQRFCVIDLKNDWWGLKSSADGKRAAIPVVIIGGPRHDVPLDESGGAAVADIVAETDHSFVIDLDALSKGKGIRFLGAFLERLYDVNREPLLLICDEADRYAPQKPMSPEAHVTLGAADDIARRGRKRGIGSLWLSQRPAVIAKNVTSQCELVVTFRTTSSLDLKELKDHIGRVASTDQVTETMNKVAGLRDGQAILMSQHPNLRLFTTAQFPMPATFDSSATPRVGHRRVEPKELAAPDLAALGERIKSAVEKAKAEDPKLLRAELAKVKSELARASGATKVERVEVAVLDENEIVKLRGVVSDLDAVGKRASEQAAKILNSVERAVSSSLRASAAIQGMVSAPAHSNGAARPRREDRAAVRSEDGEAALGKAERSILSVLAQHPDGCRSGKLALLAGYSWSGGFRNSLAMLRTSGLIEGGNQDAMRITDRGLARGEFDALPTGEDLRRYWLEYRAFGRAEKQALQVLIEVHPKALPGPELAERAGYEWSGGFRNALSALRTAGVAVGSNTSGVRASEELFG